MDLSISSPDHDLKPDQIERIERDLEKIDRRFKSPEAAMARLRVRNGTPAGFDVLLEIDYRRNHFLAKASATAFTKGQ
jgi:hypothetical protein